MAADEETSVSANPGASTTLPAVPSRRPGRPRSFWVTLAVVGVLLVAAIMLPLALDGGPAPPAAPTAAARTRGIVPRNAVFARTDAELADSTGVMRDARALLTGKLAVVTLPSDIATSLAHPPSPTGSPALGAGLAFDDPALPNCLASVTGGATLFGIDRIRYQNQPSLLVVTADDESPTRAFGYVIGTGCALPGTGIRTVVTVPLTG